MEEKERYSWYNHSAEEIYDNKEDIVFVGAITVLNQQNRRIWELLEENKQLKQQLHDLPKKIVCEISEAIERLSWRKRIYTNWEFDKEQLYKDLDTILKKYRGENE